MHGRQIMGIAAVAGLLLAGSPGQVLGASDTPQAVAFYLYDGETVAKQISPRTPAPGVPMEVQFKGNPLTPAVLPAFVSGNVAMEMSISGAVSVHLWAKSDDNPKNAYFHAELLRNDGSAFPIGDSPKQTLSSSASEFTIQGSPTISLQANATLSLQLTFYADLVPVVIPPFAKTPSCKLLYGTEAAKSRVILNTVPVRLIVLKPLVLETVAFQAKLIEVFRGSGGTILVGATIEGPGGSPLTTAYLSAPQSADTDNGTVVSVYWSFRKDTGAKDGQYTVEFTGAYDLNQTFGNSSSWQLVLPKATPNGNPVPLGPYLGPAVAIILGIVVVLFFMGRRGKGPFAKKKPVAPGKTASAPSKGGATASQDDD